jgi:hypothetical protein
MLTAHIDTVSSNAISFFNQQCNQAADFLDSHPQTYKTVLVASHFFRMGAMFAMMQAMPLPFLVTCTLVTLPSLLYRASIERFCNFRFTLPSLAGAIAMQAAKGSLGASFLTLGAYTAFVCHLSNHDIDRYLQGMKRKTCCR